MSKPKQINVPRPAPKPAIRKAAEVMAQAQRLMAMDKEGRGETQDQSSS